MKYIRSLFVNLVLLLSTTVLIGQSAQVDTFFLFFLGGQSNMEGYGYNHKLPETLDKTFEDVWIFQGTPGQDEKPGGGKGSWNRLQPGHGVGFHATFQENSYSNRFGIELTFAEKMQEFYPGQKIALIKYCKGGTSIDSLAASVFGSWEPDYHGNTGINQYDHFLATMRNSLSDTDINNDGRKDVLLPKGILWMQGEGDASHGEAIALRYFDNLKRLMDLIRAAMLTDDLPVVVGKISDSWNDPRDQKVWDHGELVQYAQEKYARTDKNAAIVRSTRYYKYYDPWHFDSAGYLDLGEKFAEAMHLLLSKN
ncbi:MAG: hypothetical protein DWQ02_15675 [Bacteroidetes bacterium]|nr:MAG: hypothetical protein DWQ02_15675 [Bacteroidota bacterium]